MNRRTQRERRKVHVLRGPSFAQGFGGAHGGRGSRRPSFLGSDEMVSKVGAPSNPFRAVGIWEVVKGNEWGTKGRLILLVMLRLLFDRRQGCSKIHRIQTDHPAVLTRRLACRKQKQIKMEFKKFMGGVLAVAGASQVLGAPGNYTITAIQPAHEGFVTYAQAVNATGEVVGYEYNWQTYAQNAFLYTPGAAEPLSAFWPNAYGEDINASGSVLLHDAGWFVDTAGSRVPVTYGGNPVNPRSMNDHGTVVGLYGSRAFVWDSETQTASLILPNVFQSAAMEVNNSGVAAGYYMDGWLYRGFQYSEADGVQTVHVGAANESSLLLGINDNGAVIGQVWGDERPTTMFLLENGTTTWLPGMTVLSGLNDSNQIIGSGPNGAVLWEDGISYSLLELAGGSGWSDLQAKDINDDGVIVGWGFNVEAGDYRAFIMAPQQEASPVPEAQHYAGLLGAGLMTAEALRRRRARA